MLKSRLTLKNYPGYWKRLMTSLAFVDTNVPIYAAGRDHLCKEPCARIIRNIANSPARYVSNAEVLQELMHHYLRTNRWIAGREILQRFETVLRGRIEPVYPDDVLDASQLADQVTQASSRDLIHAAVMRRVGANLVISTDVDFDRIPGVQRLDPMRLNEWEPQLHF